MLSQAIRREPYLGRRISTTVAAILGLTAGITLGALLLPAFRRRRRRPHPLPPPEKGQVRAVVIGCGTSEGVPRLTCLVRGDCRVCEDAHHNPTSRNRRRNTGLLLLHEGRSLMIDCGKFFWHAALDAFPRHGVLRLDAIVLSHSHNDAAYGLDDLRDLTRLITPPAPPLRVYLRECDHPVVYNAFPYLWGRKDVELAPGGGVPTLQFNLLPMDTQTFEPIEGLQVTPLRVAHGGPDGCWGFRVGPLCYISDAVSIPHDTRALMAGCEVLILDALRWAPEHPSHLTLEQACVEVERLGTQLPRKVWFVGMGHELDYTQANAFLKTRLPNTQAALAHDGLSFDFTL